MHNALKNITRPIFFSICNWGAEQTYKWARDLGNSWRTTGDIQDKFSSLQKIYYLNAQHPDIAGSGGWNDPDMLEIGNGGMSSIEYKAHFTLWSIAKAPLLIGCDMNSISKADLEILSNAEVIAINQD